jgi:Ca2+-binding RTX toxin-like protein
MQTINGGGGDDTLGVGGGLELVSTNSAGVVQNGSVTFLNVSPDGTKILFLSAATNLGAPVAGSNYFVKDLITGLVTPIDFTTGGHQINISRVAFTTDSQHVIFASFDMTIEPEADGANDIFIEDLATGSIASLSIGPGGVNANSNTSFWEQVGGNKVLVNADATNLGPVDVNGKTDVYMLNMGTGVWSLLSTNSLGQQGNSFSVRGALSADGTKVVFNSLAANMVDGDANGVYDVFVKDLTTGVVTLVSASAAGVIGNAASGSENYAARFSPDGTKVMFESAASNLVAGDTNNAVDIFIKDLKTGVVTLVNASGAGVIGDFGANDGRFSADGTKVIFTSSANNLVAGDTNNRSDVFIKDLVTGAVTRVSLDAAGLQLSGTSSQGRFAADGSIFFQTTSSLTAADTNGSSVDIYHRVAGLSPTDSYTIHGNGGNDTITGGNLIDKLYGDDGNDRIFGGGGADQLFGGAGADMLDGGDGADRFDGGDGIDTLLGGAGNDYMDGGDGADSMSGGGDNDVYIVDNTGDQTIETATGGFDVVRASVDWTLAANTESLEQQGGDNINGTGNGLANAITGNLGNNTLDGGDGGDTLDGGFGNDRLIGGKGNDTMTGGFGTDTFVVTGASVISSKAGGGVLETDFVTDLSKKQGDRIDLSAIDADTGTAGDQAFHLVTAFTKHAGEMVLNYTASNNLTTLTLDVDGDGKIDYTMKITGDVHLDSGGWIL